MSLAVFNGLKMAPETQDVFSSTARAVNTFSSTHSVADILRIFEPPIMLSDFKKNRLDLSLLLKCIWLVHTVKIAIVPVTRVLSR